MEADINVVIDVLTQKIAEKERELAIQQAINLGYQNRDRLRAEAEANSATEPAK